MINAIVETGSWFHAIKKAGGFDDTFDTIEVFCVHSEPGDIVSTTHGKFVCSEFTTMRSGCSTTYTRVQQIITVA